LLKLLGKTPETIFGLTPAERLQRQVGHLDTLFIADAGTVLDDRAIAWLCENRGHALLGAGGQRLALAVDDSQAAIADFQQAFHTAPGVDQNSLAPRFVRKLRRKALPLAMSLKSTPPAQVEWLLFKSVYKGVTDIVTKWLWPLPAYYVTKLAARLRIQPNAVTLCGLVLTILTGYFFYSGWIGQGLALAWLMTFLDTVDGKLARVTVTSSRVGNLLDHGTDVIHPPIWWICLAAGLAGNYPERSEIIWISCWLILGAYVLGRLIELSFHRFFGFNGYLLSQLDAVFRLVVARRNVILLVMTMGLLAQDLVAALVICGVWSVACTVFQAVRLSHAFLRARQSKLKPFIAT
jgi:phosphatidylglycerophosphate synthase